MLSSKTTKIPFIPKGGFGGGDAAATLYYIYNSYLTIETCAAYAAKSWVVGGNCQSLCENCMYIWGCCEVPTNFYQKYTVLMKELSRRPIICAMAVTDKFYYCNYTGVFIDVYWSFNNSWCWYWSLDWSKFMGNIRGRVNVAVLKWVKSLFYVVLGVVIKSRFFLSCFCLFVDGSWCKQSFDWRSMLLDGTKYKQPLSFGSLWMVTCLV